MIKERLEAFYQDGYDTMKEMYSKLLAYMRGKRSIKETEMLTNFFQMKMRIPRIGSDFEKLYRQGYRGILLCNLTTHLCRTGEKADERAMALFEKLKKTGYRCCLISNNKKERVEMFNQDIQVNFIEDAISQAEKTIFVQCRF